MRSSATSSFALFWSSSHVAITRDGLVNEGDDGRTAMSETRRPVKILAPSSR
jgi:hypothetical protein